MDTWKIICEMPDKEIIMLDCEPQNVKEELQKKTNKITCDSIILVEISETENQTPNGLGQTTDNQTKNQIYFKVYDAHQLQRNLNETERITAEKEQQIKEIQVKNNTLEIDLNKMIKKNNSQEQTIIQLQEQNQILQNKNKELHIEVIQITSEKNSINQVWQSCCSCLSQQMSQLCLNTLNANQAFQMKNSENLQIQIKDLEDQLRCSKKEKDELKQLLQQVNQKLPKDNNNIVNSDNSSTLSSKEIYEKLLEAEYKLGNLVEEMKEKEKQHYLDIQQLSKNYKNQSVDNDIVKMKAEKEKQIQEIQEIRDQLELELNQINTRCSDLEQNIQQLQEDNQQQQRDYEIQFQKKNEELQNEMNKKNQEIQILNAEWQNYFNQVTTQCQQQFSQEMQLATNANNQLIAQIDHLQRELGEEQLNSKAETGKLKQYVKSEREKLEMSKDNVEQLENTVTSLNDKIKKLDRELKKSNNIINELEMNYRTTNTNAQDANATLGQRDIEIKKLQSANKSLIVQIEEQIEENDKLSNLKQQLEGKASSQQQQITELKSKIDKLNEDIERLKGELAKQKQEYDKQNDDLRILQQQKEYVDSELKDLRNQLQQTKEQLEQQQSRGENNEKQISQLKTQIIKLEQELKTVQGSNKENQEIVGQQKLKLSEKDGQIGQLEIKLQQIEKSLKLKEEQLLSDQAQNKKYREQMDEKIKLIKQEKEQTNLKLSVKDHILSKLSRQDDKYQYKVVGVMEKIMSSPYKIKEMNKDANVMFDVKEYDIFEITAEYDQAKHLLNNNQYFLFEQCLKKTAKGSVTLNRSVQPNAESTFFKGYLSVVTEATQNEFKGKYLLRKDLYSQNQPFINLDEAAQMSKNNFLCQFLMEQFNKVLRSQKLKEGDYRIARQFVLRDKDKEEYYYCEMVEEGEFKKINGGCFLPKDKIEADSYFNAFSKYVYAFSKENYIISHLQICGKFVYDMIVSTTYKGLFSTLDQGESEIEQVLEIINAQKQDEFKLHWNQKIEDFAKEGLK
ncbi:unnamed protein product (macronuclear) [Paramecium tetraurelia]|uniref:Alpha-type protein kinase domain-containing protein n=1 Tax=Paramecium tetraurelia TaxID=5888 RepID=A0CFC6_PARTE|nr:uncharacterized protein GSPATT00037932001 [Paramecium tetraurelia]CAK69493.1 unnamed protein product [Paramecium tetraurelia]|eukprot:XP_001436890.1 hypothetical protein (macronuclear) [Paramecium tetraurelia strain d4-2]